MNRPPPFQDSLAELQAVLLRCRELETAVASAGAAIIDCFRKGGTLFTCGNGGSAADALHLAQELTGRYTADRPPLPSVCLNADGTALTCIANDYGYEAVFSRQVEALARAGDVLVGFTTSGNSPNVLSAFAAAAKRGVCTILVSGKGGGPARGICRHEIIVPSDSTARIQEVHSFILHQWLEAIDAHPWTRP